MFQVKSNRLLKWTLSAFFASLWLQENVITYVAQIFDSLYIHFAYLEGPPDQEICILVICIYFLNLYYVPGTGERGGFNGEQSNLMSTYWKRPWCWWRLKSGGEGDDRGWDCWMASPTQWTWVWASSWRWWRARKPGVLQSMGSQRVGHDWVTELNWWS